MHFLPIFAATLATVAANPLPAALEERQATCANNAAARILRNLGTNGGVFCSSLLSIPAVTVPSTLPAITSTVTIPAGTLIQTLPICLPTPPILAIKREAEAEAEPESQEDLEKRQLLSGLSGLLGGLGLGGLTGGLTGGLGSLSALAGSQITAGCSCLSLATRTATSTITPPPILATITSGILTTCTTSTV